MVLCWYCVFICTMSFVPCHLYHVICTMSFVTTATITTTTTIKCEHDQAMFVYRTLFCKYNILRQIYDSTSTLQYNYPLPHLFKDALTVVLTFGIWCFQTGDSSQGFPFKKRCISLIIVCLVVFKCLLARPFYWDVYWMFIRKFTETLICSVEY